MGLLSLLGNLGLGNLENADIYPEEKKKKREPGKIKRIEDPLKEEDFIYEKSYECPVCGSSFTAKTVKSGKAKLIGTDFDLRAIYEGIDAIKYDVILCPICGYAALNRSFSGLTEFQINLIKEKISIFVHLTNYGNKIYSYEEAFERYQLALASAVVKMAKASEKAYICLKSGWLIRGWQESLLKNQKVSPERIAQLRKQEEEYLASAYKGFLKARQSERFPICGMEESVLDYLLAVLAIHFDQYDVAQRLISSILTSHAAKPHMKDKARELKKQIIMDGSGS